MTSLVALQPRQLRRGEGRGLGAGDRSRRSSEGAPAVPVVEVPRQYNAAVDFVDRHVVEGRGAKIAFLHDRGQTTYQELAECVARAGNALRSFRVRQEERVALCLTDTIDFPTAFWGAIKIGAVPIPLNTSLTPEEYAYILSDARARCLVVSSEVYARVRPAIDGNRALETVLVAGPGDTHGQIGLENALLAQPAHLEAAPTTCDDIAFWLYSSGSTGAPKAAMHLQSSLVQTAALFGRGVLGIQENDVIFSSEKLFFAYGLGNSMTFPLHVGASAVLVPEQATSTTVRATLRQHQPTLFASVPSLFVSILADPDWDPARDAGALRACVSAGEALPAYVGERWRARFGVDIVDGLGTTEMLHIFLSNRPGDIRYGTAGKAVPGYELRIVDDAGRDVPKGVVGELLVKGPSSAIGYWNQHQKTMATFQGAWTRTGDKCFVDAQGYFHFCGRSDDLLKVEGMWVSPLEIEACLMAHEHVAEAAVVGSRDGDALMNPRAFVVLRSDALATRELEADLKAWVRARLMPHKCPRWIQFAKALPKTVTGKIQRFKLR